MKKERTSEETMLLVKLYGKFCRKVDEVKVAYGFFRDEEINKYPEKAGMVKRALDHFFKYTARHAFDDIFKEMLPNREYFQPLIEAHIKEDSYLQRICLEFPN